MTVPAVRLTSRGGLRPSALAGPRLLVTWGERTFGPVDYALQRGAEHMFVRYGAARTEPERGSSRAQTVLTPSLFDPIPHAAGPSDDHTSNLAAIRLTTSLVNAVVPALPPRSGVFVPEATVSNADS